MKRHSHNRLRAVEAQLRAARAAPPDELVASISASVGGRPLRLAAPRLASGVALLAAMVVAFGAAGGIGHAASATRNAAVAVVKVVTTRPAAPARNRPPEASRAPQPQPRASTGNAPTTNSGGNGNDNGSGDDDEGGGGDDEGDDDEGDDDEGDDDEPADDQYKPGKGCGDKNHVHFKEGKCKKLK